MFNKRPSHSDKKAVQINTTPSSLPCRTLRKGKLSGSLLNRSRNVSDISIERKLRMELQNIRRDTINSGSFSDPVIRHKFSNGDLLQMDSLSLPRKSSIESQMKSHANFGQGSQEKVKPTSFSEPQIKITFDSYDDNASTSKESDTDAQHHFTRTDNQEIKWQDREDKKRSSYIVTEPQIRITLEGEDDSAHGKHAQPLSLEPKDANLELGESEIKTTKRAQPLSPEVKDVNDSDIKINKQAKSLSSEVKDAELELGDHSNKHAQPLSSKVKDVKLEFSEIKTIVLADVEDVSIDMEPSDSIRSTETQVNISPMDFNGPQIKVSLEGSGNPSSREAHLFKTQHSSRAEKYLLKSEQANSQDGNFVEVLTSDSEDISNSSSSESKRFKHKRKSRGQRGRKKGHSSKEASEILGEYSQVKLKEGVCSRTNTPDSELSELISDTETDRSEMHSFPTSQSWV